MAPHILLHQHLFTLLPTALHFDELAVILKMVHEPLSLACIQATKSALGTLDDEFVHELWGRVQRFVFDGKSNMTYMSDNGIRGAKVVFTQRRAVNGAQRCDCDGMRYTFPAEGVRTGPGGRGLNEGHAVESGCQ